MFDGLSNEEKDDVYKLLTDKINYRKGDEIYKNGMLGIILSGTATIKRLNDMGVSITIRNISSGELFGAASVFGNWKDGMSSIIADTNVEAIYISEYDFCNIIKLYPQLSINYITYLSERIRFLNKKLDTFSANSTEEKLYEYLLSLSDSDGNVALSFGMTELARRLNVGRTSIYRDISSLETKGLLNRKGHSFKIKK